MDERTNTKQITMAKTAVEWLQIKMATSPTQEMVENINVWFKEAKEMEREQHNETWLTAQEESLHENYLGRSRLFLEYFKETYERK